MYVNYDMFQHFFLYLYFLFYNCMLWTLVLNKLSYLILSYITATQTPTQHGYKAQHSTVTALHTLNNTVAKGFNQMVPPARTITVALDMSKAFDTVNTHTLIGKLLQTSTPGTILKFVANYIKGRKAYTSFRNHKSIQRQVKTGVPQGGVLSPTLFNIHTADIPTPTAPVQVMLYADDITITSTHTSMSAATVTFTTDLVTRAIRSCSNTKAFGPDKLSIFHLKHLGPRATAYLTALFNDSVNSSRIPAIWKSSIVIPIPKPGKDSSQGTSYRPISLICPAAKVLEALILPTVNAHLLPADDQHGFRPGHSTTSALLQLTTDIATGFNQKKPPHRTVCVAVDLTAAFDTVSHNVLISKISRSTLPEVTCRWLSCYLRGRQAVTSCRGVKSSDRIVHTGVPQGSKLSPSLFSFYLADMPKPTYPVKRICYADDISVWASGAKIPELEVKINDYLEKILESTVTLFTPETKQAKYHPDIKIAGSQLPLNRSPKILGAHLDTSLTFNVHCTQAATRVSNRNNVLKALAGTTWGQQKETILMTYKAIGRSVANYGAPVWSTNASVTSIGKIQIAQNEALRLATGSHKMSSSDHLHNETEMLTVKQHSDLCHNKDLCHNISGT